MSGVPNPTSRFRSSGWERVVGFIAAGLAAAFGVAVVVGLWTAPASDLADGRVAEVIISLLVVGAFGYLPHAQWSMRVEIGPGGVTIRNLFRRYRVPLDDAVEFHFDSGPSMAVFIRRPGRPIRCIAVQQANTLVRRSGVGPATELIGRMNTALRQAQLAVDAEASGPMGRA